ncbi:MAG: tetratricopeptide repeat protein [Acidobacteriota bacterium]
MPRNRRAKRVSGAHETGTKAASRRSEASKTVAPVSEPSATDDRSSAPKALLEKWPSLYALVPVALAVFASINTLENGFAFDDESQVLKNEGIQNLANLPLAFISSVWSFLGDNSLLEAPYYRPLFTALLTVNYSVFETASWGWHLVNVLIHSGVTLLVFIVIKEITDRALLAATSAALFAVHPAHAESVAWISGVTDPWLALFLLPAFYFYLRYRKHGGKHLFAIALGFYFLALLSKETAVALPLIVAYCELAHFESSRSLRQKVVGAFALFGWFALPTAIYLVLRYNAIEAILLNFEPRFGLSTALLMAPLATVKYLALLVLPMGYNLHHYTSPPGGLTSAAFLGALALIAVISVLVVLSRSRTLMFAAVWFIVWLVPPLAGLRLFEPQFSVQERYLYLPSIGFCLAVALGIEWLGTRRILALSGRVAAVAMSMVLVIGWGLIHVEQNRVWNNTLSLMRHLVETDPRSPLARTELAGTYYLAGMRREAEIETRTALDLDSSFVDAYINLSMFAYNNGKLDQAIENMERAKSLVGERPLKKGYLGRIHSDLGFYYDKRGDLERAEENLLLSIEFLPDAKTRLDLGQFYFDRGRYEEALDLFKTVLRQAPSRYALIHLKLARTYDRLNQPESARGEYEKYLNLSGPNAKDRAEVLRRLLQL